MFRAPVSGDELFHYFSVILNTVVESKESFTGNFTDSLVEFEMHCHHVATKYLLVRTMKQSVAEKM